MHTVQTRIWHIEVQIQLAQVMFTCFYIVHEAMNTCLTLVSGCLRPGLDVEHFMRRT